MPPGGDVLVDTTLTIRKPRAVTTIFTTLAVRVMIFRKHVRHASQTA